MKNTNRPIRKIYCFLSCWALGAMLALSTQTSVSAAGPLVTSVTPILTLEHVRVAFSAAVDPASATNLANYSFTAGPLTVNSATLISNSVVELFTSDQTPNSAHTLQIGGVLDLSSVSMTATQLNFTSPNLTISPVRYDAGTTVTQPSGPPDPADLAGGNWLESVFSSDPGMSVGPVTDDNSTGFNAWRVTDTSAGLLPANYTLAISQAATTNLLATNGWRIVVRSRFVNNFGLTIGGQYVFVNILGIRYGIGWGMDTNGNLWVNPVAGSTYTVASGAAVYNYHTNMMVYNPATKAVSVYFDGQLLVNSYTGQVLAGNGIMFGSGYAAGKGEVNYNLVQLDVVGATRPVVLRNPASVTSGVSSKVTFIADFSQFVNAFQWLSNGVVIAGATTTNYTTTFIDMSYNNAQYVCRALSALGNVDTTPAVLTVTNGVTPPVIVSVKGSLLGDRLTIIYSAPVQGAYATDIANYTWVNAGVTNLSAQMMDSVTVVLRAGPFVSGSNYTVLVSNIRDMSSLIITNNSPASVTFPTMSPLARYDAGDTNTPFVPPNPTTPAGGNWSVTSWTDPNLSVSAVTNDTGTGLNAWHVRDASSASAFDIYTLKIATNLQNTASASGWVLTVRARLAEYLGLPGSQAAAFRDNNNNNFSLSFNLDAYNNLVVVANSVTYTVTSDGSGQSYHLHQMVYDPASATASYYFDGNLIAGGLPPAKVFAVTTMQWGGGSSGGQGTMNYNLVDFSAAGMPVTPPVIVSVKGSLLGDRFTIIYSAPVAAAYATNIANYTWVNAGVTNLSAQMLDSVTVVLRAGPFVSGSNYTVLASNIRDMSNLIITNNSPASVIFPTVSPLARYDAGDTNTAPSGPPNPTNTAGGNWSVTSWTDPNLSVSAVTNDTATGLNAWHVRDASYASAFALYTLQIATNLQNNAKASGWVLTVRARMAEYLVLTPSQGATFRDNNNNNFALNFNLDASNNLVVVAKSGTYTVTSDGSGQSYHLHQMVYDPASATASYYFDGNLIAGGFPPAKVSAATIVSWGAGGSGGQGTMNYNLVDFSAAGMPFVTIGISGNNAQISYHGVLDATSQLGNPTTWTAVATNLTSIAGGVYSVPLNGQQFFRARLP